MFVKKSTYQAMAARAVAAEVNLIMWQRGYADLLAKWNDLVNQINAKGGEDFLRRGKVPSRVPSRPSQLTLDDVHRLIQLVHPDKHGGKPAATEMTAKLLKLRESMS